MPVDWKAQKRFKTFIAHKQEQQTATLTKESSLISNLNIETPCKEKESGQPQLQLAQASRLQAHQHEVEGTLEVQRMLLHKLAQRENAVKGLLHKWTRRSRNGRRVKESVWEGLPSPDRSILEDDLEVWKRDMAQALHTIWRRGR